MKNKAKLLILLCIFLLGSSEANWRKRAKINAPYDGERFYNYEQGPPKSLFRLLKWRMTNDAAQWPEWIESKQTNLKENPIPDPGYMLINHSTVLIHINGLYILTDPIWSERTSPVSFIGPKRVRKPAIKIDDLPQIDAVVISHNHYDHFDLPTLEILKEKFNPRVFTGLGNEYLLEGIGIRNYQVMDWWEKVDFKGIAIHMTPAQHWSARGLFDRHQTLWGGYVIENQDLQIYFGGDTGYGKVFKEIGMRFPNLAISFIPIGAYEPRWFMKYSHVNPEEAVKIHLDINSKQSEGIHYGTFQLTDEGIDQPLIDLKIAREKYKLLPEDFLATKFGIPRPITK